MFDKLLRARQSRRIDLMTLHSMEMSENVSNLVVINRYAVHMVSLCCKLLCQTFQSRSSSRFAFYASLQSDSEESYWCLWYIQKEDKEIFRAATQPNSSFFTRLVINGDALKIDLFPLLFFSLSVLIGTYFALHDGCEWVFDRIWPAKRFNFVLFLQRPTNWLSLSSVKTTRSAPTWQTNWKITYCINWGSKRF